jgi:hypothetical protein
MQIPSPSVLSLVFALLHTHSAHALPSGNLNKRTVDNLPPSDQFVSCPSYRYSREQVKQAIQQGINTTPTNAPQPGMPDWQQPVDYVLLNYCRRIPTHLWKQ